MRAERIIDPQTGEMTTVYALSREHGIASYIIWHRYDTLGIRSETLIAPPGTEIDVEAERRVARGIWLRSRIGILSTHRLGEFAWALRQHSQERRAAA